MEAYYDEKVLCGFNGICVLLLSNAILPGKYKDGVIYVGPMGCRTGFYLLTRGLTPAEALSLTVESFRFMAAFEGDVPGASEVECGNYRDMDLPAAKAEAAAMLPVLEALTADELHY